MARLGFQESYRRKHNGQGTENISYCFDNLYIELLWVNDNKDLNSPDVRPLQFSERSQWQKTKASPFGIGIRANQDQLDLTITTIEGKKDCIFSFPSMDIKSL